ncbi:MAG: hypothetical protein RLY31_1828 [Bacteroidota bacterium]|jgi:2,3-bisphosphoglycerate-independent phosphoglycerate mutase
MKNSRLALIILDGWGIGKKSESDALAHARTPVMDRLWAECPHTTLTTFGEQVGLPEGQMGNSEVGHLNIGAGRVVYQELARINKAIREGSFQTHPVLTEAFRIAKETDRPVHFIGLLSDGGVHSHADHLRALCSMAVEQGVSRAYVHAFMDGRDTDPKSGAKYLDELIQGIDKQHIKLASIIGRYYSMDRDKRWERVKVAYDMLVKGIGELTEDGLAKVRERYANGETDEFLKPIVCTDGAGHPLATIADGDVVIFYNFRTDRPRELTEVLTQTDMPSHGMHKMKLHFVTMTRYDENYRGIRVVYEKDNLDKTLGQVISEHGLTQVRIAETEKYPHVTFFFSGGREEPFDGERRILIPSPKVATYDLEPEMGAAGITDAIVADVETNKPDFICLNYANADMVGHTGVWDAAVRAAETVDSCLGRLLDMLRRNGYLALVIADHGNSDYLVNEDGSPNTAHTMNPVPCILVGEDLGDSRLKEGKLGDVAPTILTLMGIPVPAEMAGAVLVGKKH